MTFSDKHFNTKFVSSKTKEPAATPVTTKAKNNSGLKKIENALDMKKPINKIDTSASASTAGTSAASMQASNLETRTVKNYKKLPVIPKADDSTSAIQMNPTSKAGFCYIGEDRGFRSCINVGEGDVCMSGDIFPTEAVCINPNLRA
jgi:trehalose/maltose hydrolase-like predicted phosphorylase